WDAAAGTPLHSLKAPPGPVRSLAFAPDSRRLAAGGGAGGSIVVWDALAGKMLSEIKGHAGPVLRLAFSPDGRVGESGGGRFGAANGAEGIVRVWDGDGKPVYELPGHDDLIYGLAFTADGDPLITGSDGLRFWSTRTGKLCGDHVPGGNP